MDAKEGRVAIRAKNLAKVVFMLLKTCVGTTVIPMFDRSSVPA
jgi:hypothetical protein